MFNTFHLLLREFVSICKTSTSRRSLAFGLKYLAVLLFHSALQARFDQIPFSFLCIIHVNPLRNVCYAYAAMRNQKQIIVRYFTASQSILQYFFRFYFYCRVTGYFTIFQSRWILGLIKYSI